MLQTHLILCDLYNLYLLFIYTDPVLNATVTPSFYSGKDISPFNTFSLNCTAAKPSNVIPPLQLSWYRDEVQVDDSISGITVIEDEISGGAEKYSVLTVTSARTFHSGLYTCSATVSIPDSNAVIANQTAIITITGKYALISDII